MTVDWSTFQDGKKLDSANPNNRWWTLPKDQAMAQSICSVVNTLAQQDSRRQTQYQISSRLYGNVTLIGANGLSFSKVQSGASAMKERISYNIIQSAIDTVTAKMVKNKPKPLFLTSGGDWKQQRKAEKLSKFIDGIFYENKAYDLGRDIFRDAGVLGDGVIKVFNRRGRVKFQRVMCTELLVDQLEAFYGNPRQLHHVMNVDRAVLIDLFPEKKEILLAANRAAPDAGALETVSDQLAIVESWHLPSGPESKDGLRVIAIEGEVLEWEEWEKDYFPFARLPWSGRLYGYWAQSAAEQLQNVQLEINKILWVIQRSFHLAGTFKILMENGSKIVKEHFTNEIGTIIAYSGTMPSYVTPPIVPVEIYQHLQTLVQQAFQQVGVSQLSAASVKPAGLNSGRALREYQDIETERFMVLGQQYENMYLELAKLSIDTVREIFGKEKKYGVKIPGKKFLETIDWKDVKLEEDEYVQKIFPVSSLPADPAGRLETITEYTQAGYLSPRAGRRLLDFPDIEQVETMANSREDWLHEVLEKMIDDGEGYIPEPEDDLAMAGELVLEYIAYAKKLKVDEERIQLLRDFRTAVVGMTTPPPAALPPGAPAGPGGPPALPMAPPTSDLLPTAPGGPAAQAA